LLAEEEQMGVLVELHDLWVALEQHREEVEADRGAAKKLLPIV
jgi:hypothetical protein